MKPLLALLLGLSAAPLAAQGPPLAAPQVYLMTMGVGADIAARFGHNAIWVHDTAQRRDRVYNFGTFSMREVVPFVINFVQGRPTYWLGVSDLQQTLDSYQYFQRSVVVQELNLTPAQQLDIAQRLAVNAQLKNREYPYDYYLDNCATRVRDLLDAVLGGALRQATTGVPAEGNLRFHTQRSTTNDLAMYLGIMALMGSSTDRPLDQWGEMFLPAKIQERVRELRVPGANGTPAPLVISERTLVNVDIHRAEPKPPRWGLRLLGVGSFLGLLIVAGSLPGWRGKAGRVVARLWTVMCGAGGIVLAYVWLGTNHVAAANNYNLLLLSPFALPLLWQIRKDPVAAKSGVSRFFWFAFAASVLLGALCALVGLQWNGQLVALVVPPSVAVLWISSRPLAARPPSPH